MKLRFIIAASLGLISFHASLMGMDKSIEVDSEDFIVYNLCKNGNAKALRDFFDGNKPRINFDAVMRASYDDDFTFNDVDSIPSAWDELSSDEDDGKAGLINVQDQDGNTPLHIACQHNHHECVKLLLQQQNIDVNLKNDEGHTPLSIACQQWSNQSAQYLLQREDIDLNATLILACQNDNSELLPSLLAHKNIDLSREGCCKDILRKILFCKAKKMLEFFITNEPFKTNLHSVKDLFFDVADIIESPIMLEDFRLFGGFLLFLSEKQIHVRDNSKYRSVLMLLCRNESGEKYISMLLERNDLDLSLVDDMCFTVFDYAFYLGKAETIKGLFNYCAADRETLYKLSNIIGMRGKDKRYEDYVNKKGYNPKFFTLLFNRFSYLGIDSLNIEVKDDEECAICLDGLLKNEENKHSFIAKLSCGHLFGVQCLSEWFRNKETCPCCRAAQDVSSDPSGINAIVGFPISQSQESTNSLLTKRRPLQDIEDPKNKRARYAATSFSEN